jgi:hypothetical protein
MFVATMARDAGIMSSVVLKRIITDLAIRSGCKRRLPYICLILIPEMKLTKKRAQVFATKAINTSEHWFLF